MDDISKAEDTNWDIGKQRADSIKPLAEISICPRKKILEAANTLKLSERYIYQLLPAQAGSLVNACKAD